MRIAVIWSRFGPYHIARLRGAVRYADDNGSGVRIYGIEIAESDAQYAWDHMPGNSGFERHTLFPKTSYHAIQPRDIHRATVKALNAIVPDAVAVNGWSMPEARAALYWCGTHPPVRGIVMSETKQDDGRRVWWKELIKRHILRNAAAALVGGREQADYLVKLGLARERIFIGYDVVDNDHFRHGAAEARRNAAAFRKQYQLPENYFFVCTRLLPRKNVDGLLKAYAAYRRICQHPWHLVIAGSGAEEEALRELERTLGVEGVRWVGFVQYDELPIYYGLASAFIHPATSEPWGLVVNEAAASGLPLLIAKSVGAGYELLASEQNGLAFDPQNADELSHALLRLSTMPESEREAMGQRSEAIVGEWGPQRFAKELLAAAHV
jgi:glycosyltransferase involved in cell wall biosynthesis